MFAPYPGSNRRELPLNNLSSSSNSRKKIKDYSYGYIDRIGKGFSSVVYKGTNDVTSKNISRMKNLHAHLFNL